MKWLSHAWREGRMSDAQAEEVERDYLAFRRDLRSVLEPATAELLDVSIHDGQVQSYDFAAGAFTWCILIGDLECGYEFLTVTYSNAEVVGGKDEVDALALLGAKTELLYDELELLADGRMEHRVLVWPEGEVWVRFATARIDRLPAAPEARRDTTGSAPSGKTRPGDCCPRMRDQLVLVCERHPDPFDCPDQLIAYEPRFQEFALIVHDGGRGSVVIECCPWCGTVLPVSQREEWLDELDAAGIEDPRDAPPTMQTSAWRAGSLAGTGSPDVGMSAADSEALAAVVRDHVTGTTSVEPNGGFFCVKVSTELGVFTLYDELDWRWLRPKMP